jgi:hypothetical protein
MKLQADLTLEYHFTQYVAIPCNNHMPLFKRQHRHAAADATAHFPTALLIVALSSSGITVITGWGNVYCCVYRRVAEESAKNYQLWNHRRKLANALGPSTAQLELQFCAGRRGASGEGEQLGGAPQGRVSTACEASAAVNRPLPSTEPCRQPNPAVNRTLPSAVNRTLPPLDQLGASSSSLTQAPQQIACLSIARQQCMTRMS